jgi:hypothetical protein
VFALRPGDEEPEDALMLFDLLTRKVGDWKMVHCNAPHFRK